jgi:threonine dehydrogenase-like Zn-dependent dehydrogenase
VEVVDRPDPLVEPGGSVVAVHSCGICGSDVHAVKAGVRWQGQVLGHEFSGTVVEVGRDVRDLRVGQAVAVNPLGGCGSCRVCRQDLPFLCPQRPNLGLTAPGGFAELVAVPRAQLFALPEGVDPELGAHAEPLAVALHAVGLARSVSRGRPPATTRWCSAWARSGSGSSWRCGPLAPAGSWPSAGRPAAGPRPRRSARTWC